MKPIVSIVIPVYNCQAYVAEAVCSALGQNYPHKQIIVVDDGSSDDSVAVLKAFGDEIELLCLSNGGPARARNAGLAQARGKYVAFLDADDVWLPGKLAAQVDHLEQHDDVGVCYTGWHVWAADADGRFLKPAFADMDLGPVQPDAQRSGWIYGRLLFDCELLTTTAMLRTETVRQVGPFDPALAVGEDYDLWLRMSRVGKITRLDCIGALYRVLATSASRVPRDRNFELDVVSGAVERFGLSGPDGREVNSGDLRRRLDQLTFQHAYLHLHHGRAGVALRGFIHMALRAPWRLRLWAQAMMALWRQLSGLGPLFRQGRAQR